MVLVKWAEPKADDDVDKVQIHRATTRTGIYSSVVEIDAQDGDGVWVKKYDDTAGSSTSWYKIRFKNSEGTVGNFSEPREAGYESYLTVEDFREKTLLGKGEVSDRDIEQIVPEVNRAILDDIAERVNFEDLDGTIDASNTEFKTAHKPIADSDLSQVEDIADVDIYEGKNTSEGNLDYGTTTVAVSSIEKRNGIVNLTTAPTTGVASVFANYSYYRKFYEEETLREAGIYLAANRLSIRNGLPDPTRWLNLYREALSR